MTVEKKTDQEARREFLGWLTRLTGGVSVIGLTSAALPLRRLNTALFASDAQARAGCDVDTCTTRDACESGDAGHTCETRDVCDIDQSGDCTNDECTEDKSLLCNGDTCTTDSSGECTTDQCSSDVSGDCTADECQSDESGDCQTDNCADDISGTCGGDACESDESGGCIADDCQSDKSGSCTSDDCSEDASGGCIKDDCSEDKSGSCVGDVCTSDNSGACTTDDCQNDSSGTCRNDDCSEDTSGSCTGDVCESDKSGACITDDCRRDASGACQADTCRCDESYACIRDVCVADHSGRCATDTCRDDRTPKDSECTEDICNSDACSLDLAFDTRGTRREFGRAGLNRALKMLYRLTVFVFFVTLTQRGLDAQTAIDASDAVFYPAPVFNTEQTVTVTNPVGPFLRDCDDDGILEADVNGDGDCLDDPEVIDYDGDGSRELPSGVSFGGTFEFTCFYIPDDVAIVANEALTIRASEEVAIFGAMLVYNSGDISSKTKIDLRTSAWLCTTEVGFTFTTEQTGIILETVFDSTLCDTVPAVDFVSICVEEDTSQCRMGDVDCNGLVSLEDCMCIFWRALIGVTPCRCQVEGADRRSDVNCDGEITIGDAGMEFVYLLFGWELKPCVLDDAFVVPAKELAEWLSREARPEGVVLGNVHGESGRMIEVPITVENPHGMKMFGLHVFYPTDLVTFEGVKRAGLTEKWAVLDGQEMTPGLVALGGFSVDPIEAETSGSVATLSFRVRDDVKRGEGQVTVIEALEDLKGAGVTTGSIVVGPALPTSFALEQNYPNPFNPRTVVNFQIPMTKSQIHTTLKIFNVIGQEVATLVDEVKEPGFYSVSWDASDMATGVYFCRMTADEFTETRRMVLIK